MQSGAIRLWGELGDLDKALRLAEQGGKDSRIADLVWLAAGDACRFVGQFRRAAEFYQKVAALASGSEEFAKAKEIAKASADAMKGLDAVDTRKIPDGNYIGKSEGFGGVLTIEVAISGGKIGAAKVTDHNEDRSLTSMDAVAKGVVDQQGVRGVDTVSGATVTSDGVLNAVSLALVAAMPGTPKVEPPKVTPPKVDPPKVIPPKVDPTPKPKVPGAYNDGDYTGSGQGHKSQIVLKITIKNSRISTIAVVSQADDRNWVGPCRQRRHPEYNQKQRDCGREHGYPGNSVFARHPRRRQRRVGPGQGRPRQLIARLAATRSPLQAGAGERDRICFDGRQRHAARVSRCRKASA